MGLLLNQCEIEELFRNNASDLNIIYGVSNRIILETKNFLVSNRHIYRYSLRPLCFFKLKNKSYQSLAKVLEYNDIITTPIPLGIQYFNGYVDQDIVESDLFFKIERHLYNDCVYTSNGTILILGNKNSFIIRNTNYNLNIGTKKIRIQYASAR